ncbi:hypothetical protein [Gallaecimonas mangrovi]|uniref:hypothetical protein n=1 Tax=Gallaecimonas mangrovi TaxID=2291597 RepID=UPI000E20B216|nr:hypothetical protein [Gallaecimonas mangrovi]
MAAGKLIGWVWTLAMSFSSFAAENVEYKCFLQLNGKTPFIAHFVVPESKGPALAFSLPYTHLHISGKPVVTKVYECVVATKAFASAEAIAQEKQQVF